MHINCRHKAQLHIKILMTHLVKKKIVATIENPQGNICFHKPTVKGQSSAQSSTYSTFLPVHSRTLWEEKETTALLLNCVSQLTGQHT